MMYGPRGPAHTIHCAHAAQSTQLHRLLRTDTRADHITRGLQRSSIENLRIDMGAQNRFNSPPGLQRRIV